MVLDKQGGPNWFENWCVAPIIVDPEKDEVYVTPIYHTMAHFSKFIRPQAEVIHVDNSDDAPYGNRSKNPDGSIAIVIFNEGEIPKSYDLPWSTNKATINKPLQYKHYDQLTQSNKLTMSATIK